jgi:hypothetical protein
MAQAIEAAELARERPRSASRGNIVADVLNIPEQMAETLPLNPLANINVTPVASRRPMGSRAQVAQNFAELPLVPSIARTRFGPQRQEAVIAQNFAELPIPRASLIAEQERQQRLKDYQREI